MISKSCIASIVLLGILFSENLFGQSITWQRTYNVTPGRDLGSDICDASNGNFYITGYYNQFPDKIIVLKLNPYGDTIWTRVMGSSNNYIERGLAIAPSTDGGCVVTGLSDSSFALKLDSNGTVIWKKYYGIGRCYDIRQSSDGGFVACGEVYELILRGYVFKIDHNGNLEWQIEYPTVYNNTLYSITQANDSGYIAAGVAVDSPSDTGKILILKINNTGNITLQKKILIQNKGGTAHNILKLNEQYIITGSVLLVPFQNNSARVFMCRVNDNGDTIFSRIFNADRQEINLGFDIINNNKYIISSSRDSITFGSINSKALIVDSTGNIINEKVFFGEYYLITNSVLACSNGDILFAGTYEYRNAPYYTIYCLRTDSNLNYPPLIPVEKIQSEIPTAFGLSQNYPNPFNPTTQIKFELAKNAYVWIKIYNTLGELVETVVNNEYKTAGVYSVDFDGTNLASGIYFYTFETPEYRESKKMVLIR